MLHFLQSCSKNKRNKSRKELSQDMLVPPPVIERHNNYLQMVGKAFLCIVRNIATNMNIKY